MARAGRYGRRRIGEEDLAVPDNPAPVAGKVDDGAFRVEKEERLGRAERQRGVGALAARGDVGTDLGRQDLEEVVIATRVSIAGEP